MFLKPAIAKTSRFFCWPPVSAMSCLSPADSGAGQSAWAL